MENPFEARKSKAPRATRLLAIDAWIDSSLYEAGFKAREAWENITIFFRRFRVTGWRRALVELGSEGFTLGTLGTPEPRFSLATKAESANRSVH